MDEDNITITGAQGAGDTITIADDSLWGAAGSYSYTNPSYSTVTIGTGGSGSGGYLYSNGTSPTWTTSAIPNAGAGLHVTQDATFEGDIKWKGRSLGKLLEAIEDRLAILSEPSPEKLEKYAALKKAYDNYKLLEKLIGED